MIPSSPAGAAAPWRHVARLIVVPVMLSAVVASLMAQQGPSAPASAAPAPAPAMSLGLDPATGALPRFVDLFMTAPVLNGIILGLSAIALMLFLYFLATINTRSMMPPTFADDVTKLVLRHQYEQAADHCRRHRHLVAATILERVLENANKDTRTRMAILQAEGQRRAELIWNRISYLIDISNLAPMLGLLGTVYGMIQAFFVLPSQSASMGSAALAKAIGTAMTATFFGIGVAILAVVFHTIIKSRATSALAEVEQSINTIADHIRPTSPTSVAAPPPIPGAATTVAPAHRPANPGVIR